MKNILEKDRALKKVEDEINKNIGLVTKMAKLCGTSEFLYFFYYLHLVRLLPLFPNKDKQNKNVLKIYQDSLTESIKYIISLIAKFGKINSKCNSNSIDLILVQSLLKIVNSINSKYESTCLIQLFDVELYGKMDQYAKIDMSELKTNIRTKKFFNYFQRIEDDNNMKNISMDCNVLISSFKKEYLPFSELFENEIGVSIDEFCWLKEELLKNCTEKMKSQQSFFSYLPNGNIDVQSEVTFREFSRVFLYDKEKFFKSLDSKFHPLVNKLTFKKNKFDELQLRFHHITREPIFEFDNILFISPELILDSMFSNTHYSMLENSSMKEIYKAKQASSFLDKIANIAKKYGYTEIEREKELYQGKKQIGDIDIIFKNEPGNFLLVEAKNHVLPLDIYFKDIKITEKHLAHLQKEWERKVLERVKYLNTHYTSHSLPQNYLYVVVSRFPEVISHFSNILFFSIQEFEIWLEKYPTIKSFEEFFDLFYSTEKASITINDIQNMYKQGVSILSPFNLEDQEVKQHRNERCFCGSGKKYKKCCML